MWTLNESTTEWKALKLNAFCTLCIFILLVRQILMDLRAVRPVSQCPGVFLLLRCFF